ncbi:MAG: tetratricopeptide repeat protein [Chloroflexi bacterium]|nr:tetratricopeptide repeat protein [Chloroflexota bacterium]MCY4248301.1 tetratricopeptide repeat protein [Chloroflexota bacterium]
MMLRHFLRDLPRRAPEWDKPTRLAVVMAVALLAILLMVGLTGPPPAQLPARLGAFGLLVTLQLLFLWGNRRDISPYHQAQQRFIAGDYAAARSLLAALPEGGRESVDALVLLGNSCRNLGQFAQAQRALQRALDSQPRHHLALFSMGKLLMMQGQYRAAREFIEAALAAGSPDIVRFELGQCHFLAGDEQAAREQFLAVRPRLQEFPEQAALLEHYLHQLGVAKAAQVDSEVIQYWRGEAQKAADTAYGEHLRRLVCAWTASPSQPAA